MAVLEAEIARKLQLLIKLVMTFHEKCHLIVTYTIWKLEMLLVYSFPLFSLHIMKLQALHVDFIA